MLLLLFMKSNKKNRDTGTVASQLDEGIIPVGKESRPEEERTKRSIEAHVVLF